MLFSSLLFLWIFLPILLFLYFIFPKKIKNYLLLFASILFYVWGGIKHIIVIFYIIIINYFCGLFIAKSKKKRNQKIILVLGILLNILPLIYFKYFSTMTIYINQLFNFIHISIKLPIKNIILPLGISFFTFQALSYLIDLYRKEISLQKNPFKLALYIMFFPQLVAGPIVKYKEVEKEIDERKITIDDFSYGIKRFIFGLSKKVLIANTVASVVDEVLGNGIPFNQLSTPLIWLAVLLYTIQIYYDFSGYSDMAIGLGRMFGFHFGENFNYPYISTSIQEFWRRWHISLSTWFKEYIYIPLGGNRKGTKRTLLNLFIVFILTGIWHGASLNFWVWGLWHGTFILLERIFLHKYLENNKFKFFNSIYVMTVVILGWALFYCNSLSQAMLLFKNMFTINLSPSYTISYFMNSKVWIIFIVSILLCGPFQLIFKKVKEKLYDDKNIYGCEIVLLSILFLLCITYLISGTYNPFIYFRF